MPHHTTRVHLGGVAALCGVIIAERRDPGVASAFWAVLFFAKGVVLAYVHSTRTSIKGGFNGDKKILRSR